MLHKEFSRFYRRWVNRIRREKLFRVTRRPSAQLSLTQVEDRLAPALNPQTLITKSATPITFTHRPIYSPDPGAPPAIQHSMQVAADPNNSARQVAFGVSGNGLVGIYSVDGGNTWSDFYDTANTTGSAFFNTAGFSNRIRDTSVDEPGEESEATRLDAVTPSVAWDRNGMVYMVRVERSNGAAVDGNNPGSGVVALDAFDFSNITNTGSLPPQTKQRIIYRWHGSDDAAYNPVVAVNNNIASYTDPVSGTVLQDRDVSRAVYVAWNTNAATSGNRTADVDFINATTFLAGSVDKGQTFTNPILVGGNSVNATTALGGIGYNGSKNTYGTGDGSLVAPQIVFSAPGAPVAGVAQPATMNIISAQKTIGTFLLDQSTPGTVGTAKLPFANKTFTLAAPATIDQSTDGATPATTPDIKVNVSIPAGLSATDLVTDLNVRIVAQHGNLDQLNIVLFNNLGNSITLLRNRTLSDGSARPNYLNGLPQGVGASQDLGRIFGPAATVPTPPPPPGLINPGITFDDAAPRPINDTGVNDAPYIGYFRPEDRNRLSDLFTTGFGTPRQIGTLAGDWFLRVSDSQGAAAPQPQQRIIAFDLQFTFGLADGMGADRLVLSTTTVPLGTPRGFAEVFPTASGTSTIGIGGFSVAVDNSYTTQVAGGANVNNLNQGRMYLAYTVPAFGGDIQVTSLANGATTWSDPVFGPDDTPGDNFTEGNRAQFNPNIAVDPASGTVAVSWYDARFDASLTRINRYVVTSNDGGQTFNNQTTSYVNLDDPTSKNRQTFFDAPKTAVNAITKEVVTIEPIPSNMNVAATVHGFGTRQSMIFDRDTIYGYWSGNKNAAGTQMLGATARVTAGPRVVDNDPANQSDQGIVLSNVATYITATADGTPLMNAFKVVFDRPINPATFTSGDVTLTYFAPDGTTAAIPVGNPTPIGGTGNQQFLVPLVTPSSKVGSYTYTVTSDIRDSVNRVSAPGVYHAAFPNVALPITDFNTTTSRITLPALTGGATITDLNVWLNIEHTFVSDLDIFLTSPAGTRIQLFAGGNVITGGASDNFTNVMFDDGAGRPATTGPFSGAYVPTQLLSAFNGENTAGDWILEISDTAGLDEGRLLNWSLQVAPVANLPVQVIQGNALDQNADGFSSTTDTFDSIKLLSTTVDRAPLTIPGPFYRGSSIPGGTVPTTGPMNGTDTLFLNTGAKSVVAYFDRDIDAATFPASSILRMTGPFGNIAGPFSVTPTIAGTTPGSFRGFTIGFPQQVVDGSYSIEVAPTMKDLAGNLLDNNKNAAMGLSLGGDPLVPGLISRNFSNNATPATVTIQPNDTSVMDLTVAESFIITQNLAIQGSPRIQVQLNISHPNVPDLVGTLIAPDGTRIPLFTNVGTVGQPPRSNFVDTIFRDDGTTLISLGAAPFNLGTFIPQQPLGSLVGKQAQGIWRLEITNSAGATGTINRWSLQLPTSNPGSGLGEAVADRFQVGFRLFTQDPSNPLTQQQWTPVGPATISGHVGRTSAVAVDPSDPSGNTVYVGSASGGIWKTTNFNTLDAGGPNWIPITDFGPTSAVNIGSIALFPRNNDPAQTIVYALTGEGNTQSPGVGVLRSMDGGRTWRVLDSTNNADATGAITPIDSPTRDRIFVGSTGFKIITDPNVTPTGEVIVYMAISNGPAPGIYRSINSGRSWVRMQAGNATDVVLAAGSIPRSGPSRNAEILYGGIRGQGVFIANSAPTGTMTLLAGGLGNPNVRTVDPSGNEFEVTVNAPTGTPNGAKGRIVLAVPFLEDTELENSFYQGWLYAAVATAAGDLDGLYQTKDFGRNWTEVNIPRFAPTPNDAFGTNNETRAQLDPTVFSPGSGLPGQGNYDLSLAVSAVNPNVVYLAGLGIQGVLGSIRLDLTNIAGSQTLTYYDNSDAGGANTIQFNTNGGVANRAPGGTVGFLGSTQGTNFLNFTRDPDNPFVAGATLFVANTVNFVNDGIDIKWTPYTTILTTADIHQILSVRDPYTRRTRLIYLGDQSISLGVDNLDGTNSSKLGFTQFPANNRIGNMQNAQFYSGAAQPSTLAADIAQAMFYGGTQDNGSPASAGNVLQTGNIVWVNAPGDASGTATDQTGSGTSYVYQWPCCGPANATDFFRVDFPPSDGNFGVGRTQGLLRQGLDDPGKNKGQWPLISAAVGYFTINPLDKNGALLGSGEGRLYRSTTLADPAVGANWFVAAEPGQLDSSLITTSAFGAPDPANPGQVNNFVYAGTANGNVFVSNTGGAPFTKASTGLFGGQIETIKPNPRFGSKDAYAVTDGGVFYNPNPLGGGTWVNVTGNLFTLTKPIFGESPTQSYRTLTNINALEVDWRYAIPDDPLNPTGPTHPVLYVGGDAGVFRSRDKGATWQYFPSVAQDGSQVDGGFLPNAEVTDLDLSLGNIDPATGLANQGLGGLNFLLASTYGRGQFGIRLNNRIDEAFFVQFESGPFVTNVANPNPVNGPSTQLNIRFDQAVDPVTLSIADIKVQRPDGSIVPLASVTPVNDNTFTNYIITFATPEPVVGFYRLSVGENDPITGRPALSDFAGNLMNQNQNKLNGETLNDNFVRFVFLNGASANSLVADGLPIQVVAGTAATFTVTVQDPMGNAVTNATDTVTFTFTDPSVTLPNYTFTLADMGSKAFTVTFTKAGLQSVTVNPVSPSLLNPGKDETFVLNAPASQIFVTGYPSPSVAGTQQSFTVTVADKFGNTALDYTGTVSFSSSDKNPQTVLPLSFTFTSGMGKDNGVRVFNATLTKAGLQSITATDTVTPTITGTQNNIQIINNVVSALTLTGYPSPSKAGSGGNVTVTAIDAFGNTVLDYTGSIRFTSTDIKPSTVLPPDYTFKAADMGVVSLPANLTTTGVQTITATDLANSNVTGKGDFVVTPGAAASYTINGFPSPTVAGVDGKFTVTVFDLFGNIATDYLGTAVFTSSDPQAGLPGNITFTGADAGIVTLIANLKTAGLQSISAADITNASLSGTQSNILVNPAAASTLKVAGFPSPVIAGVDQGYVVTAFDPFGNVATGYTGTVMLTSTDPQAQLPPTTYTFLLGEDGTHTFTGNLRTAGTFSITATDTTTASITGTQNGIVVLPAAAKTLSLSGFPNPTTAGVDGAVTITARDAFGNVATGYTGTVSLTSSDGQAGLPQTFTFTAGDAGARTVSANLKTAGFQSITATDTADGTILGSQSNIKVNPAAASVLGVTNHTTPVDAGSTAKFTVTAFDPFGNVATGYTGKISFLSTDKQATLPTAYTFTTADAGTKAFTDILRTAGLQTVTAADVVTPTIAGSQSNILVRPIAPASISIQGFPSPTTAGVVQNYTVIAKDKFGNATPQYTGTVNFTSTDKLAGLPTSVTFTAGDNGVRTLQANLKTAGTQSITVADASTPGFIATQSGIQVVAADAAKMFVTALPTNSAAGKSDIVQVSFKDVFGNIATGYTGTVRFSSTDAAAGLPADYTFSALDQGVKNFTVQLKTAGTQTLTVVDIANPSLGSTQSGLVVTPGAASKLAITALPASVLAGVPTSFVVTATDNFGNVDTSYNGIVTFTSSDPRATLPTNVAFAPTDLGKRTFGLTFGTPLTTSTVTVRDISNANLTGTATATVLQNFDKSTTLTGSRQFAVGTESRSSLPVRYFDSKGQFIFDVFPFQSDTTNGGGRVSTANFNGDGRDEIVVSSSPGMSPAVVVIDGFTEKQVLSIQAFEASFQGGVFVTAGDINGDGVSDLAVSPDEGGGPRVRLFDGKSLAAGREVLIADFFGIDDSAFRGGARAAIGDLNGDGFGDLIVSAGFGGGPRLAAYNGASLAQGKIVKLFDDFFAFEPTLRNGVFVAAGDVDGDGKADLVTGAGPGGGPRVSILSGNEVIQNRITRIADFFGGDQNSRGGIRVAVKDLDDDNQADVIVGSGVGSGNRLTAYIGKTIIGNPSPTPVFDFDVYGDFTGGIFVG